MPTELAYESLRNIEEPHLEEDEEEKEDLVKCALCGEMISPDDAEYDGEFGEYFCHCCWSRSVRCDGCNHRVLRIDTYNVENDRLCEDCYDLGYGNETIVTCENCGSDYYAGNCYNTLYGWYCDGCYRDWETEILEYHSDNCPEFKFYGQSPEDLYFGIELEVDGGYDPEDTARDVKSDLDDHAYCCYDASLSCDGFEIITHPHTFEKMNALDWETVMGDLRNRGYKNYHPDAGMHVHLSKDFFNRDFDTITRFVFLFERFKAFMKLFAHREMYTYCQFCTEHMPDSKPVTKKNMEERLITGNNHRQAVNIGHRDTVEVRIFNGTTDADQLRANLELTNLWAHLAKRLTDEEAETIPLEDTFAGASENLMSFVNHALTQLAENERMAA